MKSLNYMIVFAVLAALVVGISPQAQAAPIYGYDFNSLTPVTLPDSTHNLAGQDDWKLWSDYNSSWTYEGVQIVASQSPSVNNTLVTKYAKNQRSMNEGNWKSIAPIAFTGADTAVTSYVHMSVDGSGINLGSIYAGFLFKDNLNFCFADQFSLWRNDMSETGGDGTTLRSRFFPNTYTTDHLFYVGQNDFVVGDWYEIKGVMDFSVTGGQVSYSYRNLTTGEANYNPVIFDRYDSSNWSLQQAGLSIIPMGLTPDGLGEYVIDGIGVFTQRASSFKLYSDNYSLGEPLPAMIPEPSTLVLLGMGLVGLLAYAWRKRK